MISAQSLLLSTTVLNDSCVLLQEVLELYGREAKVNLGAILLKFAYEHDDDVFMLTSTIVGGCMFHTFYDYNTSIFAAY